MLRLLKRATLSVLCAGATVVALAADPSPADLDHALHQSQQAIDRAEQLQQNTHSRELRTLDENPSAAGGDAGAETGFTPRPTFPTLDPAQISKMQGDIRALLAHPQAPSLDHAGKDRGAPPPLIFVSFSIPEDDLRGLLREAARTGSPVVLRGMVDNSMKRTVERLGALLGKNTASNAEPSPSLAIDPTLFERFKIDQVPAFVLPMEAADPCTPSGCPTPEHLKLAGDVSLSYALGVMAREASGSALGARADDWKHRLDTAP